MTGLVASIRARRIEQAVRDREAAYGGVSTAAERRRIQVDLLNTEWRRAVATSPYYASLARARSLPSRFDSLEAFVDAVPVTGRSDVQSHGAEMTCRDRPPEFLRTTGGSTSQPVQIPSWKDELRFSEPDLWMGRGWYGITPASRLFMIWGHSHALGRGWMRHARRLDRGLRDALLGYTRFPAYDLGTRAMRSAADALLRAKPDYLLGYAVALDRFARANADRRADLRGAGVKLVVGTSESFPSPESPALLEDLFGCAVGMEYGAVETGVIAHTHPSGGYRFFWRSYLVEAVPATLGHALRVTSLYPRCFPLVRYDMGDEVDLGGGDAAVGLASCARVLGRCNDYVVTADGTMIHSEAFSHAFKPFAEVTGFQVVQHRKGLAIRILAERDLPAGVEAEIRARLRGIHRDLGGAAFERCRALEQTIAGKTRMVIRDPES